MLNSRYKKKPSVSLKVLLFVAVLLSGSFTIHTYNLTGQVTEPGEEEVLQDSGTGDVSGEDSQLNLTDIQQLAAAQLWAAREQKAANYRTEVLQFSSTQKAFKVVQEGLMNQQAELRSECRDDLRTANKYTLLPKTELCWLKDLELEKTILAKQRDYLEQVPGIQDDVRQLALTRNTLLEDAIAVVINAIDNQVYVSVEELEEVKQALTTKYRIAKWTMDIRVKADMLLTRTNSIILRVGDILETSGLDTETQNSLIDSLNCFAAAEQQLVATVESVEYQSATNAFAAATEQLRTCATNAQLASEGIEIPEGEESGEQTSEPTHTSAMEQLVNENSSFLIHGIDAANVIDYEAIKEDYSWTQPVGEQADGPDPADCDLSGLSRKTISRLPKDENGNPICRLN